MSDDFYKEKAPETTPKRLHETPERCAYCGDPSTHPVDLQWSLWATCDRCWKRLKPKEKAKT